MDYKKLFTTSTISATIIMLGMLAIVLLQGKINDNLDKKLSEQARLLRALKDDALRPSTITTKKGYYAIFRKALLQETHELDNAHLVMHLPDGKGKQIEKVQENKDEIAFFVPKEHMKLSFHIAKADGKPLNPGGGK